MGCAGRHESPGAATITLATTDDAGELLTLQRAAYVTEAQAYDDPHLTPLVQTLDELVAELSTSTCLKAVLAHRIVGSVRTRVEPDDPAASASIAPADGAVLHIGRLVVAPDQHGRGIGTALLRAAEGSAPAHVTTAALFTGHLSIANLRLYERLGYVEQRRDPPVDGSVAGSRSITVVHLTNDLGPA